MKKRNLVKSGLFTVVGLTLLISCSGNSEDVENVEEKVVTCDCEGDIYWDKGIGFKGGDKFTGICETKNERDEVTERIELKNGYKIHLQRWETVNRELVQNIDMKYFDNKKDEGWELNVKRNNKGTFFYVDEFKEYKKGVQILEYRIQNLDENYEYWSELMVEKEGQEVNVDCRYDGQLYGDEFGDKIVNFFDCVKGQNLPKFFYTKI